MSKSADFTVDIENNGELHEEVLEEQDAQGLSPEEVSRVEAYGDGFRAHFYFPSSERNSFRASYWERGDHIWEDARAIEGFGDDEIIFGLIESTSNNMPRYGFEVVESENIATRRDVTEEETPDHYSSVRVTPDKQDKPHLYKDLQPIMDEFGIDYEDPGDPEGLSRINGFSSKRLLELMSDLDTEHHRHVRTGNVTAPPQEHSSTVTGATLGEPAMYPDGDVTEREVYVQVPWNKNQQSPEDSVPFVTAEEITSTEGLVTLEFYHEKQ